MPRPHNPRRIRGRPESNYFKPAGVPLRELVEVTLSMAEFESLRLIDAQNMSQEAAAEKMEVSQPTLSRILSSARKKVADAVVEGKAIRIN